VENEKWSEEESRINGERSRYNILINDTKLSVASLCAFNVASPCFLPVAASIAKMSIFVFLASSLALAPFSDMAASWLMVDSNVPNGPVKTPLIWLHFLLSTNDGIVAKASLAVSIRCSRIRLSAP